MMQTPEAREDKASGVRHIGLTRGLSDTLFSECGMISNAFHLQKLLLLICFSGLLNFSFLFRCDNIPGCHFITHLYCFTVCRKVKDFN